jgi:hypothetical protein
MVKKLGFLGVILIVVAAAGMVCAETNMGAIPAPTPTVMPAIAPPACVGPTCAPPPPMKVRKAHKRLTTSIKVDVKYPAPAPPPMCGPVGCAPPPIPVAVPMCRFIVPWPPFVYYLPID